MDSRTSTVPLSRGLLHSWLAVLAWGALSISVLNIALGKALGGLVGVVAFIAILIVVLEGSLASRLAGRPYLKANLVLMILVAAVAVATEVVGTISSGSPRSPFEWGQIVSTAGLVVTLTIVLYNTLMTLRKGSPSN